MKRWKHHSRSGWLLVAVLVCLLVVSSLAMGSVATAIRHHREVKLHQQLRQTEVLIDSGFRRSMNKVREDPSYNEDLWRPVIDSFDGEIEVRTTMEPSTCRVTVTMKPTHGQTTQRSDQIQRAPEGSRKE